MVLFELLGTAEAPEFRQIQRMVMTRLKRSGPGLTDAGGVKSTSMFTAEQLQPKAGVDVPPPQPAQPAAAAGPELAAEQADEFESTSLMRQRARAETDQTAEGLSDEEHDVIDTVEIGEGVTAEAEPLAEATEQADNDRGAADAPAKNKRASSIPSDVEVLDIEALVDLRDSAEEEQDEVQSESKQADSGAEAL
jgi:hypothetical protein